MDIPCEMCHGTGQTSGTYCMTCSGTGDIGKTGGTIIDNAGPEPHQKDTGPGYPTDPVPVDGGVY